MLISVKLEGNEATALEGLARAECRTLEGQARYLLIKALRQTGRGDLVCSLGELIEGLSIKSKRTVMRWVDQGLLSEPTRVGRRLFFTEVQVKIARDIDSMRADGVSYADIRSGIWPKFQP